MNLQDKKVLFLDLDDTLIHTVSGKTFPEDVTDFRINKVLLDKIRQQMPNLLFIGIVTNQGGIPQFVNRQEFEAKLLAISTFVQNYTGIPVVGEFCTSEDDKIYRKPQTGMLTRCLSRFLTPQEAIELERRDVIMIGDASGKEGDFSDSDKRTAENFDIDYIDIWDFLIP